MFFWTLPFGELFSRARFFDFFRENAFLQARIKSSNLFLAEQWADARLKRSRTSDGLQKKNKAVKKVFAQ